MEWFWLMDRGSKDAWFKGHVLPESLSAAIIDDLKSRGLGEYSAQEVEEISIDLPGMCMIDRSWHNLELDGITVKVPSADVSIFYGYLKELEERVTDGKPYYKLHANHKCIVLTPELREQMLGKMAEVLLECEAIESAENEDFNRRIDAINKGDGVKVLTKPRLVKHKKVDA